MSAVTMDRQATLGLCEAKLASLHQPCPGTWPLGDGHLVHHELLSNSDLSKHPVGYKTSSAPYQVLTEIGVAGPEVLR